MLKIFELLGNGASQILQLFLPFACFPKFYLECGPPTGTWTLVSLIKLKKNHLMKMQENQLKKSKMFHFSLQCWQHGEDLQASGGWDRLMVKCQLSL